MSIFDNKVNRAMEEPASCSSFFCTHSLLTLKSFDSQYSHMERVSACWLFAIPVAIEMLNGGALCN
jgi:hypothetical protein